MRFDEWNEIMRPWLMQKTDGGGRRARVIASDSGGPHLQR